MKRFAAAVLAAFSDIKDEWVWGSFDHRHSRKDGSINPAKFSFQAKAERAFFEALLTEIGMPEADGSSKAPQTLTMGAARVAPPAKLVPSPTPTEGISAAGQAHLGEEPLRVLAEPRRRGGRGIRESFEEERREYVGTVRPSRAVSRTLPSASACGDRIASRTSAIGPAGIPPALQRSSHVSTTPALKISSRIGTSAARFETRPAFVEKRGSAARSGRPMTLSQKISNCRSVPTARRKGASAASNIRYGSIVACELPCRTASRPVTSAEPATFTSAARPVETRFVFTWAPAPSRPRAWRAARISASAAQPARTSTSATPILCGAPSAGPVIAIRPVAPCARRSNPGSPAWGPTSPAPEIEHATRRGLRARRASTPMPRFSALRAGSSPRGRRPAPPSASRTPVPPASRDPPRRIPSAGSRRGSTPLPRRARAASTRARRRRRAGPRP